MGAFPLTAIRILLSRFFGLFRKTERETDLNEELRSHLNLLMEGNERNGMPKEQARFAALRSLGGVEQIKENYRDQRGLPPVESFFQDL